MDRVVTDYSKRTILELQNRWLPWPTVYAIEAIYFAVYGVVNL